MRCFFELPFSTQSDMLIDRCPQCGGTFWDFREVAKARRWPQTSSPQVNDYP